MGVKRALEGEKCATLVRHSDTRAWHVHRTGALRGKWAKGFQRGRVFQQNPEIPSGGLTGTVPCRMSTTIASTRHNAASHGYPTRSLPLAQNRHRTQAYC